MATRIFCDHCGNTIREPLVYSFGPLKQINDHNSLIQMQMQQQRQLALMQQNVGMGGNYGGGAAGIASVTTCGSPTSAMIDVDLCPVCAPIWMERVKNLTKRSDPED
jgi:hypothetical protein